MAIDISNRPDRPIRKYTITQKKKPGFTADLMKLLAIIAMTIEHIAWIYVPFASVLGQLMHIIGRLTAPLMCFFIAQGYRYTRSVKAYAVRLGIFALISHIPYVYFETGKVSVIQDTSIMFTLFLGLMALIIINSPKYSSSAKTIIVFLLCLLSTAGDWGGIGVVWIVIFGSFYSRETQVKYFCLAGAVMIALSSIFSIYSGGHWYSQLFQLGIFLAVPLILKYNGERRGGNATRWFYYIYYPAHMVFLRAIEPGLLWLSVYILQNASK